MFDPVSAFMHSCGLPVFRLANPPVSEEAEQSTNQKPI